MSIALISLLLLLLGICSALIAGSEVAFFSLTPSAKESIKAGSTLSEHLAAWYLGDPNHFLITLIISNAALNTAIAAIGAILALRLAPVFHVSISLALSVEVVIVTLVTLIGMEVSPKILAARSAERFIRRSSVLILFFYFLCYPLARFASWLTRRAQKRIKVSPAHLLNDEQLKQLADVGEEHGSVQPHERDLVHGAIDLYDDVVRDLMVSRVDMVAVPVDSSLESVIELIRSAGYPRIPVYRGSLDEVVGILYAKDLVPFLSNKRKLKSISIGSIMREPVYVPEMKSARALLQFFQRKKVHLAIVVDEYGGTAGMVTMKDIFRAIVGKSPAGAASIQTQGTGWLVDGRTPLEEIQEQTGIKFRVEDPSATAAVYILERLGHLPRQGEQFKTLDTEPVCTVTIHLVRGRRIVQTILTPEAQQEEM